MSKLLKTHWPYFQLLITTTSRDQRKRLLETITKGQLRTFVQIVVNFLQKVFTVRTSVIKTLDKHKRFLRTIADTSVSLTDKKKIVRQRGNTVTEFMTAIEPYLKNYVK